MRVETVSHDIRMSDGPMFARLNASALAAMSATAKTMSDAEREEVVGRIVSDSLPTVAKYTKDGALVFARSTKIATARV